MKLGVYKTTGDIHLYDCKYGQLKIPKNKEINIIKSVNENIVGVADGIVIPERIIKLFQNKLCRQIK